MEFVVHDRRRLPNAHTFSDSYTKCDAFCHTDGNANSNSDCYTSSDVHSGSVGGSCTYADGPLWRGGRRRAKSSRTSRLAG